MQFMRFFPPLKPAQAQPVALVPHEMHGQAYRFLISFACSSHIIMSNPVDLDTF